MPVNTEHILSNDSLAARLFQGHDYNRSLVGDSLVAGQRPDEIGLEDYDPQSGIMADFFNHLVNFLSDVPVWVYVIIGVVVFSLILYWMYRSNLFYKDTASDKDPLDDSDDDIYAVDIDSDLDAARQRLDFPAIVRLVYLSTLRKLDEGHLIDWRIYKTPTQYAGEFTHPAFATMTRHFLRVRYGKFPATQELCDEMDALSRELEKGGEA